MKTVLITGSSGLIGSEVCVHFRRRGYSVHGVDNNQRAVFFGPDGDTRWNQRRLETTLQSFATTNSTSATAPGVLALVRSSSPPPSSTPPRSPPTTAPRPSPSTTSTPTPSAR